MDDTHRRRNTIADMPGLWSIARRPWAGHLLALAGYTLCTLLLLLPLLPHFGSAIPGGPIAAVDGWQNVWSIWWVQRALASGMNPFYTPYLFYPQGAELYLQPIHASNGVLVFPITALFGPVAGYNAAALLAFILAGMGGYGLALQVSGHRLAAFAGGLVFAFSPFHVTKLWDGQLELVALQWLAFYALFLLRTIEGGRKRDTLLAGLFLALAGYTSWYYFLYSLIYTLLFGALWLPRKRDGAQGRRWAGVGGRLSRLTLVGVVAGALLAPLLLPGLMSLNSAAGELSAPQPTDVLTYSANLLDFWLPSYLHPLLGGGIFEAVGQAWGRLNGDWNAALGYSVLALALLGCTVASRAAWRWFVLLLATLLLALGPVLQVGAWQTGLPLPYALLLALPGAEAGRRPMLMVAMATLMLAPLVALGARWLVGQAAGQGWQTVVAAGVLLVLAFELLPPRWPLHAAAVHPYYASLAGKPGALLDVPPPRYKRVEPQKAQMTHGMPIFGGYLARTPLYPFVREMPGVRQIWSLRPDRSQFLVSGPNDPLVALNFYNVTHVVVHWDDVRPQRRADAEAALAQALPGVAPVYADGNLSAYEVPQAPLRPFATLVGPGWHREEGQAAQRWRWMRKTGEILLINPTGRVTAVTLSLRAQSYLRPRPVDLLLDGAPLTQWQVGMAETPTELRLLLPPGAHRLLLRAPADEEQGDNSRGLLSIALVDARLRW